MPLSKEKDRERKREARAAKKVDASTDETSTVVDKTSTRDVSTRPPVSTTDVHPEAGDDDVFLDDDADDVVADIRIHGVRPMTSSVLIDDVTVPYVVTADMLRPGERMADVVPATVKHYAYNGKTGRAIPPRGRGYFRDIQMIRDPRTGKPFPRPLEHA